MVVSGPVRTVDRAWIVALAVAAVLLFAVNAAYMWPGTFNADSTLQMQWAHSNRLFDWHPPAMTRLMQALLVFGDGPAPFLTLDLVCYWAAFAIIGYCLLLSGRRVSALLALGVGAVPLFVMLNITVGKDVVFVATFLLAFAMALLALIRPSRASPVLLALATVLLLFSVLLRYNAVFAAGPMLALFYGERLLRRPVALLAGSLILGLLLVPVAGFMNRHVFGALDARTIESLQYLDLAGIAARTGDVQVFGAQTKLTQRDVAQCYQVEMWDTLSPWGRCPWFTVKAGDRLPDYTTVHPSPIGLPHLWTAAIARHPAAYLSSRIAHFNSELYFFVPDAHTEAVRHNVKDDPVHKTYKGSKLFYFLRYSPLFAPALFVALDLALMIVLVACRRAPHSRMVSAATALVYAALLYAASYLVVGVATDSRYFLMSSAAALLALIMLASDAGFRRTVAPRRALLAVAVAIPLVTLVSMEVARIRLPVPVYVPLVADAT